MIEFFEAENNVYLVMEFVEGENLADRIARVGVLPEREVIAWSDHLLDALIYCHNQYILHRDIKPQNIVIRPDGQAVLGGFGLPQLKTPGSTSRPAVQPLIGTAPYSPPEQYTALLLEEVDPRSDLYSLGATLYHALTGQAPLPVTSRRVDDLYSSAATLYQSLTGHSLSSDEDEQVTEKSKFISIRDRNPAVSLATEKVVRQAMELETQPTLPGRSHDAGSLGKKKSTGTWLGLGHVGGSPNPGNWWSGLVDSNILVDHPVFCGLICHRANRPGNRVCNNQYPYTNHDPYVYCHINSHRHAYPHPYSHRHALSPSLQPPIHLSPSSRLPTRLSPSLQPPTRPSLLQQTINTPTPVPTIGTPAGSVRTRSTDGMVMVFVPAGQFLMGSPSEEGEQEESPQHLITLDPFWIDKYEVTNVQFAAFLNEAGDQAEGDPTLVPG